MSRKNRKTAEERFREKIRVNPETQCWIWTGSKVRGYGRFRDGGRVLNAHRFSWEMHRGPIPDGMQLDHFLMNDPATRDRCSRACCNPEHLEIVTNRENLRRSPFHAENGRRTSLSNRKHDLLEGVSRNGERFRARIWNSESKRVIHLGTFDTPQEAHERYIAAWLWLLAGRLAQIGVLP